MPFRDGFAVVKKFKEDIFTESILVVMLAPMGALDGEQNALNFGVKHYASKPFDPDELRARLRALIRRQTMQVLDNALVAFGDLQIRMKARTVHVGQAHNPVSPKEFELVACLVRNAGEVVTRTQLLENVWNLHFDPQTNVVESHMSRLRAKVDKPFDVALIETLRGSGYRIAE